MIAPAYLITLKYKATITLQNHYLGIIIPEQVENPQLCQVIIQEVYMNHILHSDQGYLHGHHLQMPGFSDTSTAPVQDLSETPTPDLLQVVNRTFDG